jgi:hypothetical protein
MPKQQDRLPISRKEVLEWLDKSGYPTADDELVELVVLIIRYIEAYHGIKL